MNEVNNVTQRKFQTNNTLSHAYIGNTHSHSHTHKHYTNNNKIDDVQLWLEQKNIKRKKKMLNKKKWRKSLK